MLNGDSNENGKNKNNRSKGTIKRAAKKRAICFGTFMQNQLNNVRCCALYHSRQKKPCNPICRKVGSIVGGKTRSIAIH